MLLLLPTDLLCVFTSLDPLAVEFLCCFFLPCIFSHNYTAVFSTNSWLKAEILQYLVAFFSFFLMSLLKMLMGPLWNMMKLKKLKIVMELGREMYKENIYIKLSIFVRLHNHFFFVMSLFRGPSECLLDDFFSIKLFAWRCCWFTIC